MCNLLKNTTCNTHVAHFLMYKREKTTFKLIYVGKLFIHIFFLPNSTATFCWMLIIEPRQRVTEKDRRQIKL